MKNTHIKRAPSLSDRESKMRSQKIGKQLETLYRQVAEEPVPDDFMKLLEQADAKEAQAGKGEKND